MIYCRAMQIISISRQPGESIPTRFSQKRTTIAVCSNQETCLSLGVASLLMDIILFLELHGPEPELLCVKSPRTRYHLTFCRLLCRMFWRHCMPRPVSG